MFSQKTYQSRSLTRWLLSVTLMFSVFSVLNYVGHSSLEQATNPIELVSDTKSEIGKQIINYKSAAQSNGGHIRNFSESCELCSLRVYNQLEKVKFNTSSNQTSSVLFASLLYQVTRVQQNSKEYPSPIALG